MHLTLWLTQQGNNTVKSKRPVNLDLSTVKFPITALVSILHRVSGVVLLAGVVILLWMLDMSLDSQASFDQLQECMSSPIAQFIIWGTLAALAYHMVMGLRHLLMDMGIGETLKGGVLGAQLALVLAIVLILAAAGWIWIW